MADPHKHITQTSSPDDQPTDPTNERFKNIWKRHFKKHGGPGTGKEKPQLSHLPGRRRTFDRTEDRSIDLEHITQTSSPDDQRSDPTNERFKNIWKGQRFKKQGGPGTGKEKPQLSRLRERCLSGMNDWTAGPSVDQDFYGDRRAPKRKLETIMVPHIGYSGKRSIGGRSWTFENPFDDPSIFKETPLSQVEMTGSQEIVRQYKLSIKQKYESEWSSLSGEQESLSSLYNEPVIIQKNENGSFKNISVDSLLMSYDTMTVILQGDSGSGKSIIAQKIMLDWASETSRHFYLVFYLRCEELMCVSEEINFIELLSYSCSLTSDQISQMLQHLPEKVLFIIDGFDELRLTQDIYDMSTNSDPLQKASPGVILCGLMRRYLIHGYKLLVTTRTRNILNKLLKEQPCFTEIMGFSEKKVEMYFQKFFSKEYDCVRANETLLTACSIPVICWIISEMFRIGADVTSGLETITSIYVDFVSTLLKHHCQGLSQSVPTLLRSLGQLAERGMLEQQVLFDEKSVNETVSDPAGKPFLCRFLSKRRIRQDTMFTFMHHSIQEFFTALYYVLLDEEETQMKVRELLHTVERGWALSCWSDGDFSMADVEVTHAKQLQPVILFLCGFFEKEWIPSFTEKHNMAVSVNIETQLKEWINRYSQRYQNEHMLFILHCFYELHEKSFIRKVLEGLVLIDLSNTPLKMTDCWVLKYCLQCCEHIRNLKLHVTSDNLKMLRPELYRCKELWLMMDHIPDDVVDLVSDDVVGLVSAAAEGKILNNLNIKNLGNYGELRRLHPKISVRNGDITLSYCTSVFTSSATELTVTSPRSFISTINWMKSQSVQLLHSYKYLSSGQHEVELLTFLKSVSGVKKVCLQHFRLTKAFASEIPSFIQACPSLNELSIHVRNQIMLEDIQSMKTSLKKMGWTLTIWGKLVLIKPRMERFTEEKLKTKREKSESGIGESSDSVSKAESTAYSFSKDVEVFTPELSGDEDNTMSFVCPRAGQFRCSLTNLVFVMEGEGEVLYRVVSWDPRLLDGLGQMQPAGPLYNIDCAAKSVSQLHLPHCVIFSEENKDGLTVAHVTGDNIEMIQPLKVTETHVMIDIRDLSCFGLWIKTKLGLHIDGQVLLFLRPVTVEQKQKILNVHLLPGNVPVSEVQRFHHNKSYIETSSKCRLFTDREYSLCCQPEDCEVQPMTEMFQLDNFGPNYHPTFEVLLDVDIGEVRLGVLDKTENGKEVWHRRRIFLTAPSKGVEPPPHRRIPESEFVNTHKDKLIDRVSSAMEIADSLNSNKMITLEVWNEIHAAETRRKKMRLLLDALESGGDDAKVEFCRLLKEKEPHLVNDLAPHL